jgi:Na+/H+ antiporter NhaC
MSRNTPILTIALVAVLFPALAWAQAEGEVAVSWVSLLPPLVAIGAALALRSVVPALFIGVWLGAWLVHGAGLAGAWYGLLDAFQVYSLNALADPDHAAIILFSFMISGLVGIVSHNGGMQGIVNAISRYANSRRRGQLATFLLGLIIFIDDYANSLVVGNTMRPITDRLRISRAKLAYLVDSTAAPVATIALVTTWIGYQVGLIADAIENIPAIETSPYLLFVNSIAYSFYPWFCIFLLLIVCWSGRDIGPMVAAEKRACAEPPGAPERATGTHKSAMPERAMNAIIPITVLIVGVGAGIVATGEGDSLRAIIETADSYRALMWASVVAVVVAIAMSIAQRLATLDALVEAWLDGVKSIVLAMIILVLAWALAGTTDELNTAEFLASLLGNSFPGGLFPAIVFIVAAITAFATGTSWGTMGILMPLAIPLAWDLIMQGGGGEIYILYSTIAAVLAGAVWGDHCSPISDTTILSSMASGCDHMEHVRTQLPYAFLAAVVALLVGVLPTGFGFPWWLSLAAGAVILTAVMRVFGKHV